VVENQHVNSQKERPRPGVGEFDPSVPEQLRLSQTSTLDVLLVRGDQESYDALVTACATERATVSKTPSLQQAVEALQSGSFGLVIMTVDRSCLGQAETLAALLNRNPEDQIPCVFIAEDAETQQQLVEKSAGVFDTLLKPLTPAMLAAKIRLFSLLHRQREQLSDFLRRMKDEIDLATRVQSRFLPKTLPVQDHSVFSRYHATCSAIGGDLQDVFDLGRGRQGVYIADVAGHGTSAAMLSGLVKMSFESLKEHIHPAKLPVSELLDPGVFLTRTNAAFHEGLPLECFVTLMYAVVDPNSRILRISNAGHPHPVLYRGETGEASYLHFQSGPALGPVRDAYFPITTMEMRADDKLLLYTDGLVEAINEEGVEFGYDRLLKMMSVCGATPPDQLVETIAKEMDTYRGRAPLSDDCSLLVIHFV
jgi:phosphoserine phosphatase RsbU/P